jgi:hypothetical protein
MGKGDRQASVEEYLVVDRAVGRQAKEALRVERKEYGWNNLREQERRKVALVNPIDQRYYSLESFVVVVVDVVEIERQSWCGREYEWEWEFD